MGLQCQYGIRLQWVEDSAARGICHGREGVWSSSGQSKNTRTDRRGSCGSSVSSIDASRDPQDRGLVLLPRQERKVHLLNTFTRDIKAYFEERLSETKSLTRTLDPGSKESDGAIRSDLWPCGKALKLQDDLGDDLARDQASTLCLDAAIFGELAMPSPSGMFTATMARSLDDIDGHILRYYDTIVCGKAGLLDDELNNPLRYVIFPMAVSSPIILSAVLTVGATKLSQQDPRFIRRILLHRQTILTYLTTSLQRMEHTDMGYLEVLACIVMLCWSDVQFPSLTTPDIYSSALTKDIRSAIYASLLGSSTSLAYHRSSKPIPSPRIGIQQPSDLSNFAGSTWRIISSWRRRPSEPRTFSPARPSLSRIFFKEFGQNRQEPRHWGSAT